MTPAWLPRPHHFPGMLAALALAAAAFALGGWLKLHTDAVSDVVLAIAIGAVLGNSPLGRLLTAQTPEQVSAHRIAPGIRFTSKWLLRLAIILMGLKIQTGLFQAEHALVVALALLCCLPAGFFIAHAASRRLGLSQGMGDLLSIGTMVCGASAINALSPTIDASERDQGISITAVFVFSVAALLLFHPVATTLGVSPAYGGLWAGLAVNDLSGSVAVGEQFGSDAGVIAAAVKSVRIVLLGPLLVGFSLLRNRGADSARTETSSGWTKHLPLFIVGYFAMFGVRVLGDRFLASETVWTTFVDTNHTIVKLLILMVCVGIGLQIRIREIIDVGWRSVLAGGAASFAMAGLSLAILYTFAVGSIALSALVGVGGLAASFVVHRAFP